MWDELIDEEGLQSRNSGYWWIKFARTHKVALQNAFGRNGVNLRDAYSMDDPQQRYQSQLSIFREWDSVFNLSDPPGDLELYSRWLQSYSLNFDDQLIYVPGTLSSVDFNPLLGAPKIVGFGRQLKVFPSKQRPKLMTMYADDDREYR